MTRATRLALTFDDGPGPSTEEILQILSDAGVRATFFVLGRNLGEAPWCGGDVDRARSLVIRAMRAGHVVGNHSYSHTRPPDGALALADEIRRTDDLIRACRIDAGVLVDAPIPFRLPYGIRIVERTVAVDTGTIAGATLDPRLPVIASLGRTHVHWTSDFDDWTDGELPGLADAMIAHVEALSARGLDAVLDLHDSGTGSGKGYPRSATARATRTLVDEARRRGWETFTVPAGS